MKKIFLIVLLTVFYNFVNAQVTNSKNTEVQAYQTRLSQSSRTLVLNLSGFSLNYIGGFKDELIGWKEKVISATINENTYVISIVHNELLDPRELNDVLNKYQIAKDRIISHN